MNFSKVLPLLILTIFLLNGVAAVTSYASFGIGETQSATIDNGNSIIFNVDFFTMNSPMNLRVELYDSSDNLIHTFLNQIVSTQEYFATYTIDKSIYGNSGNYKIILNGNDAHSSQSHEISLIVNNPVTPTPTPADTTAPVITITGINPVTIYVGNVYTDAGATASDNIDGNISSNIHVTNTVNTNLVGSYSVTYSISDHAGNIATATRTVNVIANPTPTNHLPIITSTPITSINEGHLYSYQITATDSDGDALTYSFTQNPSWLSISSSGLISGTAPSVSSDTTYPIGISVSDGIGNTPQTYDLIVKNVRSSSGGSSGTGFIVTDHSSTNKINSNPNNVNTESPVMVTKTNNTKQSYLIVYYLLVGVILLGTLITIYALNKRVNKK